MAETRTERVDDARQAHLDAADGKARQHMEQMARPDTRVGVGMRPIVAGEDRGHAD